MLRDPNRSPHRAEILNSGTDREQKDRDRASGILGRVPLCCFSQARGGAYADCDGLWDGTVFELLGSCPLGLTRTEGRKCLCKRKLPVGENVTPQREVMPIVVSTCTYPETYSGQPIRNEKAFADHIRRRAADHS